MTLEPKLEPKHNWIQIDISFDKERDEKTGIVLLPEDYKPSESPYKAVSVETDPREEYKYGDVVIVPAHIIREVDIREFKFYLIERNHIMAKIT